MRSNPHPHRRRQEPRQGPRKAHGPTPFPDTGTDQRGHQTPRAGVPRCRNWPTATTAAFPPCAASPAPRDLAKIKGSPQAPLTIDSSGAASEGHRPDQIGIVVSHVTDPRLSRLCIHIPALRRPIRIPLLHIRRRSINQHRDKQTANNRYHNRR
jgi:hypothetical protein